MHFILLSFALLLAGVLLPLFLNSRPRAAQAAGLAAAAAASAAGLVPAVRSLLGAAPERFILLSPFQVSGWAPFASEWPLAAGSFVLALDPLSALFTAALLVVTGFGALYACGYLHGYTGRKPLGLAWAAYNGLTASMLLVFTAADAVPFMVGWELMAVSSLLLVLFEHEKEQVRKAAFLYLSAGGAGALLLLALFSLLAAGGSLEFSSFVPLSGGAASAAFLLALAGFGLKAGVIPLHVWLPEAHPAAPSHVSAVMSGVMIKTGIYGLLRILPFLGPWRPWWGWTLLIVGALSCLGGVLFSLAQHELKRVLAYSSIENAGIILLAVGLGLVCALSGAPAAAGLAFAGALLHVVNHALFKGLLFMGAGAVLHGAGTAELEALGGLSKRMPAAAGLFISGSAAACALPPFNGFAGEFLIYSAAFAAMLSGGRAGLAGAAAGLFLAAAGALAVASFARAAGTVFLGEPRTQQAASAQPPSGVMTFAMAALGALCLAAGLAGPLLADPLARVSAAAFGVVPDAGAPLLFVSASGLALLALAAIAAGKRAFFVSAKPPSESVTWDCGYAAPTPRMQYGASSFAQPLTDFFQPLLRKVGKYPLISEYFPARASFSAEAQPVFYNSFYMPAAGRIRDLAYRFSWLQHGRLQIYILYIVATLIGLLLWKL